MAVPPSGPAATLFLCGDVMTGRGVDQLLAQPSQPRLYERSADSALDYVELAEASSGPLPRAVKPAYVWGDALAELDARRPDARVINLETAVTTSATPWPGKGIHYRMHPANADVLTAAQVDCCTLANNHVLDWGREGLVETLATLHRAGIRTAGAGVTEAEATAPAILALPRGGRVLVFSYGLESAGVGREWAAAGENPGVNFLPDCSERSLARVTRDVRAEKRAGDLVIASLHWGENWGHAIETERRTFARALVTRGDVDVVHGHSSHHPQAVELHQGRLILYGCGDFLNDYEGIEGYESYRPELTLMYFPTLDVETGRLLELVATPMRIHRFRLERASDEDGAWLTRRLAEESARFHTRVERRADGRLRFEGD